MKTSIYTWFGFYLPFEERIRLIKDAGFDEVIISWEDEYPPFEIDRFRCAELARKYGLGITHAHSSFEEGYDTIWSPPSEKKERFTNIFKNWIEECADAGIDTLVVHTNGTDLSNYKISDGIDFFKELTETAEKEKVKVAVENVSRQFLVDKVLDKIDSQFLGLCYDSGHDFMTPCGRGRLLEKYKDRLYALHLQDNDFYLDRHWLPGEGQIPFERIIPLIKESNYPVLSLEVGADPKFWVGKKPEDFLKSAFRAVNSLKNIN